MKEMNIAAAVFIFSSLLVTPCFADFSSTVKYTVPDELYSVLENDGFNDTELDEISVENGSLVVMFDSEKLNIPRAYKTIASICDYTKENPSEWDGREFTTIEVMPFLQSVRLIFDGGIKSCLKIPFNAKKETIASFTEIKRSY
ncbi:hypothetical protein SJZ84_15830 [Hafnia paralvei]|uniref:hypothetical protein n=1 Tax=Hafnia paralvei TaxID=546367 RepID=UPI0029D48E9B|nr:hypothetical protein [Hafnia paralvei]MDX6912293.1 hypothetical protein [Hafnia paralvei]